MSDERSKRARAEGEKAFREGISRNRNPFHHSGHPKAILYSAHWDAGWTQAKKRGGGDE